MDITKELHEKLLFYWEILIESIPRITLSIIITTIFILIAIGLTKAFRKKMMQKAENKLVVDYVVKLVKFLLILAGIILGLHTMGLTGIAGGLLAGAGAGAVILGFAFKEIGENFLAGVILVFDRPFNLGDTVTVEGNMGKITALNFRTTEMKTFDGRDVYIPNILVITNEVYNHTQDGFLRLDFLIGIDYDDNITEAIKGITKIVNANSEVLKNEKTLVLIDEFAASSVNLKVMFWVNTKDYKISALETKTEIMRTVKNYLLENKFGLPANIQEIKMYKPEPIPIIIKKESDVISLSKEK
ncbi:small-conductance mechanosensitive channel [Bernardetia litoralis DSM 6794]|uniref:Small-conductance mechanosensitive channel n=1 Tax=Bernardetia litoralis (strain ATCC 23117 / DSM 6794 / NBRC 15988 / NCIMB 1366 / Fx l1 / Sio-4) TaxID=880071 RepID=I4AGX8_BERLS|nr:mechanosensitive ion channel domain-containing protein [Bernardetia litoralis]AFM03213.1 small-conductance mechanosensitive channel [Bernardetia litoralis DSM 6794]